MTVSDRALPADPATLVDVERLLGAYYDRRPDPGVPSERVAFGTSGHRGSSLAGSFNEAHILATTQAICAWRRRERIAGPLFLGRDTHALSEPALRTAIEVLVANEVDVRVDAADGYTPTPALSHAILVHIQRGGGGTADGIVVTPSHNPPEDGGFKNPPSGGPDASITTAIEDEANELSGAGLRGVRRDPFERAVGEIGRYDFMGTYVADLGSVVDMDAIAGSCFAWRGPSRRRSGGLLGGDPRSLRPRSDGHERVGRSAVRVHDLRLGRADPDGPVVAARDGASGRVA